jgi:hypothetical protein
MAVDTSQLAPAPHEPRDSHERKGKKSWNVRLVASVAAAALAVGFGASRLLSSEDEPTNRPPAAAGGLVPGNGEAQPTPSASETTETEVQLSPAEQQIKLFERVDLPATAISAEYLTPLIDRNALDTYIGVDGGVGLYPDAETDITSQRRAFYNLTPEDIDTELNRIELLMTGTHLDVVDGKVVRVPNTKLMENGIFRGAMSTTLIEENTVGLEDRNGKTADMKSAGAAGTLADAGEDRPGMQIAAEMLKADARVETYYAQNPEEMRQVPETNPAAVIEASFATHGNVPYNFVENRLIAASGVNDGDVLDGPNYETTRIVDVYDFEIKNADSTKTINLLGVSIVGETQNKQLFTMTVALIPTEKSMGVSQEGTFVLKDAPENTFHAVLVGKDEPARK